MTNPIELEAERQLRCPNKRLVVCLDGTWNSPDQDGAPTNVVKIMRAIQPEGRGRPQIAYYGKGIGTDGSQVDRVVSGLTGRGLEQDIRDGYRFLAHNWSEGDEIYIFGFSRGAFTGRSLCGLISLCGLLPKAEMDRLETQAWPLYEKQDEERDEEEVEKIRAVSRCEVKITCLGVWDTVGARGVPVETLQRLNRRHEFHNTELSDIVECAFHALAIDEKRGPFAPTLWQGRQGQPFKQKVVEQVWFPGVHQNVGGGYPDTGLSDLALMWMIKSVEAHTALAFNEGYVAANVKGDWRGEIDESRSALYSVSKYLYPYERMIGQCEGDGSVLRNLISSVPGVSERRNRPSEGCEFINEMIHWSAVERFGQEALENGEPQRYAPANLKAAEPAWKAGHLPIADERILEKTADIAA